MKGAAESGGLAQSLCSARHKALGRFADHVGTEPASADNAEAAFRWAD